MKGICSDAAVWVALLSTQWFRYYLPALLVATANDKDPFTNNIRGLLHNLLSCRRNMSERDEERRRSVYQSLSPDQRNALEAYIKGLK